MRRSALLLVTYLLLSSAASADESATQSPFRFGFGARDLAMGGADVSGCDYAAAPFWNASRLALAPSPQALVFHANLFESGVSYDYAGMVWPTLDFGAVGLGVARLGVSGIERRDAGNALLGDFSDERFGVFLGYARTIAGNDLGLTMTLEHHQVDTYRATSSPGLGLSISRTIPVSLSWIQTASLTFDAGNLLNPTTDLVAETVRYPRRYAASASFDLRPGLGSAHRLRLSSRAESGLRNAVEAALGIEYSFGSAFHLRGGLRDQHLSGGVGIGFRSFRFDYGLVGRDLGSIHLVTLTCTFGKSVNERRRHRQERQEFEFQRTMAAQAQTQNATLIATLASDGEKALAVGSYEEAFREFDRALFMARMNGLDTTSLAQQAQAALAELRDAESARRYTALVDSASARFGEREFLGARYYAELALRDRPDGDSARILRESSIEALEDITARDHLIRARLSVIDSLQAVGDNSGALTAARALAQFAPTSTEIEGVVRRIQFEVHRSNASRLQGQGRLTAALAVLDSAHALYPNHQWCLEFRNILRTQSRRQAVAEDSLPKAGSVSLSKELATEAGISYRQGRSAFESGQLSDAIESWEKVERIAPNYESVRNYLIKAYRLMGVESYGQNDLEAALTLWRKAIQLDPKNEEIQAFIVRAEAELGRLRELSYDDR